MLNYDVIIAGSGVAGLYAALNLDSHLKILLLSKKELTLCNSALAQGGVAAVFDEAHDNIQLHINDSLVAGGFKNNPNTLRILVSEGPSDVRRLIDYGVDFDKKADGSIHLTLEGGHSRHRILHHKDATGNEIVTKLLEAVKALPNVDVLENTILCDLKKNAHGFSADVIHEGIHTYYNSHFTILATGGIGRVYEYTTNSAIATGDGIAFAYQMGADIKNLSLVQFHPTAFANAHTRECFLISEAVRGEGAYLLNCNGERFMHRYDDRLELAPRDVVSHSIILESRRTGSDNFYLDITHKDADFLRNRFPMIYRTLLTQGYDLTKDKVPIFPCQHYLMGGINVDENAQTSVNGLYAAGECSHTGVHGNNRLASNSLLEALVFSRQAALSINTRMQQPLPAIVPYSFPSHYDGEPIPAGIRTGVRHIMQHAYFVIPDKHAALIGFERIVDLKRLLESGHFAITPDYIEARSLVTIAYLILKEVI